MREHSARPWHNPAWHAVFAFSLGALVLIKDLAPLDADALVSAPRWAHGVVLAGMCALLLLRKRMPVAAMVAGWPLVALDVILGLTLPVLLVAGEHLHSAVLYGSRRASRVIASAVAILIAGVVVIAVVRGWNMRSTAELLLTLCALPLVPVWWGMNMRQQRESAEAERARADDLARIAALDRDAAVHAERASMARDLHDVIAGHLSAIAIQSEALLTLPDGHPRTRTVLRSVRENSVDALAEMRAMIGLLRADDDVSERTAPARLRELDRLIRSARASGLDVRVDAEHPPELPAAVDLSAFRIVQEALTNAVKHAPGSRAEVNVRHGEGTLVVEVIDDGAGAVLNPSGTGLITMSERAQAVGGVLVAGPCARGWRVRAELPVEDE
ncbi:sensor histidine kinase [Actinokineospora xionganensis]|uniref:histidine kinase n=1 Tax=Actinokineospora xionganensis TaxID=2684470 RepID=A0ABR7L9D6_9PSEU|nr:histidine kinase [Actinokineospora xionganensis]MBC6449001.1 two-component sensor histidine kinase [Actinokineospora xionganensis]